MAMKKLCVFLFLSTVVLATPLTAQEIVINGDFETESYSPMWTLFGGNKHTEIATFETVLGQNSTCLMRRPGSPDDNGGITQQVHLFGGMTYKFSANIAAAECG
jgi:hypothetical protein